VTPPGPAVKLVDGAQHRQLLAGFGDTGGGQKTVQQLPVVDAQGIGRSGRPAAA